MNENVIRKFVSQDAVFLRSFTDGKSGIFRLWVRQNDVVSVLNFTRKNGSWVLRVGV